MILLALALAALLQDAPAATPATPESEITVLGRKARSMRLNYRFNRNGTLSKCWATKSSGDAEVDALGCESARQCAASGAHKSADMKACVVPLLHTMLETLADRRVAARMDQGN